MGKPWKKPRQQHRDTAANTQNAFETAKRKVADTDIVADFTLFTDEQIDKRINTTRAVRAGLKEMFPDGKPPIVFIKVHKLPTPQVEANREIFRDPSPIKKSTYQHIGRAEQALRIAKAPMNKTKF